jgi:hypothetical protein
LTATSLPPTASTATAPQITPPAVIPSAPISPSALVINKDQMNAIGDRVAQQLKLEVTRSLAKETRSFLKWIPLIKCSFGVPPNILKATNEGQPLI